MDAASGVGAKTTTESMLQSRLALEGMALAVRGLSHSLYNALGPAMGNLNLLSGNIADAKQSAIVDDVVLCLRQAERLAESMRAVVAWHSFADQIFDPAKRVRNLSAKLATEPAFEACPREPGLQTLVRTDPAYFDIAANALLLNAQDAIKEGGRVTVECAEVSGIPADFPSGTLAPGLYFVLGVSNPGGSMSTHARKRCFEPGFTGKGSAHGGLGLWFAREFAHASGGEVAIVPGAAGQDVKFVLAIPAALAMADDIGGDVAAGTLSKL